jgi:hypothetical protein
MQGLPLFRLELRTNGNESGPEAFLAPNPFHTGRNQSGRQRRPQQIGWRL